MQRLVDNSVFHRSMGNPVWERILPELISRLLSRAKVEGLGSLRIPAGENYKRPGLDGQIILEQNFGPIPAGRLVFEFGSQAETADFKNKANDEFLRVSKLKTDYDDLVFVVVGRALWDDVVVTKAEGRKATEKAFWIEESLKAPGQPFKEIVIIDQERLIILLSNDLPTAIWLYEKLGLAAPATLGVRSTEQRIDIFQRRFSVPVSPALLVEDQDWAVRIVEQLSGAEQRPLTVFGNTPKEAAVAVAHLVSNDSKLADVPAICVSSENGVKLLEGVNLPHIVILEDNAASKAALTLKSHRLVLCKAISRQVVQGQPLVIGRPEIEIFAKHIGTLEGDLSQEQVAKACGRTLTALERRYPTGFAEDAPWDDPDLTEAPLIRMLAAVGGWNTTKIYDREADSRRYQYKDVSLLLTLTAQKEYKKLADIVKRFGRDSDKRSGASDPLFAMSANVVAINAPLDALFRLAGQMTDEDFDALENMLIAALSSRSESLPNPDAIYDPAKEQGYSENLVGGLILTFVLIGVFGAKEPLSIQVHGRSSDQWCSRIYKEVVPELAEYPAFSNAIRQWQSLLAEGMPYAFLESLETLLKGQNKVIQDIFKTQESRWGFGQFHLGTAILWALERLAWREELVERVCETLFDLHVAGRPFDGRVGNTPLNSLKTILYPGLAQTSVDAQTRIKIFSRLAARHGTDALSLFVPLIDTRGGWVMSTSKPLFTQVNKAGDTWQDVYDARDHLTRLSISCASNSAKAISELVDPSAGYKAETFDDLILAIQDVEIDDEGFDILREEIRDFVGRHRRFSDAKWAAEASRTERLEHEAIRLTPNDSRKFLWLFEKPYVDLHEGDYKLQEKKLEEFRNDAALYALCEGPTNTIQFILSCESVGTAAMSVGRTACNPSDILYLCRLAGEPATNDSGGDNESVLLRGLSGGAFSKFGEGWLNCISSNRTEFSDQKLRRMGGGLYPQGEVTQMLCETKLPESLRIGFWSEVNVYAFFHHKLPKKGIDALLNAGRAHEMAALISKRDNVLPDEQAVKVAKSYVDHLAGAFAEGRGQGALGMHNFWEMLGALEARKLMTLEEIAKLEFPFARTFRFDRPERPLAIHRLLATEPNQVLDFAKIHFKSDDSLNSENNTEAEEADVPDQIPAANRESIYHVFDTFDIIPGRDGSSIDGEVLSKWIEEMHSLFLEAGFKSAYSVIVGELLSNSPADPDDQIWPHQEIRKIIEKYATEKMISACVTAEFNNRGVIVGSAEQYYLKSSDKFKAWADQVSDSPKTQTMLNQIVSNDLYHSNWDRQRQLDANVSSGLR